MLKSILIKNSSLLFCCLVLSPCLFSQTFDRGYYNDFDFGPHIVYGNFQLRNPRKRTYFEIKKANDSTCVVYKINPSGIKLFTYVITFNHGELSRVEKFNQWGAIVDSRKYEKISTDLYKLTDIENGVNAFLPGKYGIERYQNELLRETSFYTASGRLIENDRGYAIIKFDPYEDKVRAGEKKSRAYFNAKNQPVISTETGFHSANYEFDLSDNKLKESYYGISGEPVGADNDNAFQERFTYDQDNNCIKTEFLDKEGNLTQISTGIATISIDFKNGYAEKITRYNVLNKIARTSNVGDGISIIKSEFDPNGNKTRDACYDEFEKPMRDFRGVFTTTYEYSPENKMVAISYFDPMNKPIANREKIHRYQMIRDSLGRLIQETFFDSAQMPVKNYNDEVYMIKYKSNVLGSVISESYWKDSLTPMPRWNGVYEIRTQYNEDGQPIEFSYIDQNGQLQKTADGYSVCKLMRDENGLVYARQYLYNNELINITRGASNGYSVIRYDRDSAGRTNQILFYGNEHEAIDATIDIENPIQAHRILFIYQSSRLVEEWYYSIKDDLVPFLKLDCIKNDYLEPNGINIGQKDAN